MNKTPKFKAGDIVKFTGQNYSLLGDKRSICTVVQACWNKEVRCITYNLKDNLTEEMSFNNYEDMISEK